MATIPECQRFIGDEDALQVWWRISGQLVDFHTGYTFEAKLASVDDLSTILFTKTTGFTGAVGSGIGSSDSDVPNLTVTWASVGELNSVTDPGKYYLQIKATKTADTSESTLRMRLIMDERLG